MDLIMHNMFFYLKIYDIKDLYYFKPSYLSQYN